jgi:hypothetical protein
MPPRAWVTPAAVVTWVLAVTVLFAGGALAWVMLGAGLCEDVGSPGSDAFCNHGGLEASGVGFVALFAAGLVVPVVGLAANRKGLFWSGVLGPVALAALNFVLWWTLALALRG